MGRKLEEAGRRQTHTNVLKVSESAGEKLQKFHAQGDRNVCLEYECEDLSNQKPIRKDICQSHKRSNATADFESPFIRSQKTACLDEGYEDSGVGHGLEGGFLRASSWPLNPLARNQCCPKVFSVSQYTGS